MSPWLTTSCRPVPTATPTTNCRRRTGPDRRTGQPRSSAARTTATPRAPATAAGASARPRSTGSTLLRRCRTPHGPTSVGRCRSSRMSRSPRSCRSATTRPAGIRRRPSRPRTVARRAGVSGRRTRSPAASRKGHPSHLARRIRTGLPRIAPAKSGLRRNVRRPNVPQRSEPRRSALLQSVPPGNGLPPSGQQLTGPRLSEPHRNGLWQSGPRKSGRRLSELLRSGLPKSVLRKSVLPRRSELGKSGRHRSGRRWSGSSRNVATPTRARSGSSPRREYRKDSSHHSARDATAPAVPRLAPDNQLLVLRPPRARLPLAAQHFRVPVPPAAARLPASVRQAQVATASHPTPPMVRPRATAGRRLVPSAAQPPTELPATGPRRVLSVGRDPTDSRRHVPRRTPLRQTACAPPTVLPTPMESVPPAPFPCRTGPWQVVDRGLAIKVRLRPPVKVRPIGPARERPGGPVLRRCLLRSRRPVLPVLPMGIHRIPLLSMRAIRL
jgi:hypothetical protein